MKEKCIPFYLDNNSSNLPFYLTKDTNGNDVIYINDKNIIYTNTKNNQLGQQLNLFIKCFNQGICSIYKINDSVSIIRQFINNNINWYINTSDNIINVYSDYIDQIETINIHYNSKYLCLTSYEYGECVPDVVAGYDLTNNKLLDCSDYNTMNSLYRNLVEVRRCRFDVIASILTGRLVINDINRLFRFMSFILDRSIDDSNYKEYMKITRDYVLEKYPKLNELDISNIKNIDEYSKEFGINYFHFNKMDEDIKDLKYVENKTKVK